MAYTNSKINQYAKHDDKINIFEASPHRLVQMLMMGAVEKIHIAKGHMERGSVAEKGRHISWAISIIDGLRSSIDKESGGDIANNLDDLYDYMSRRLLQANIDNDSAVLEEVASLLLEVKSAWDAIPDEAKATRAKLEENPAGENLLRAGV